MLCTHFIHCGIWMLPLCSGSLQQSWLTVSLLTFHYNALFSDLEFNIFHKGSVTFLQSNCPYLIDLQVEKGRNDLSSGGSGSVAN